MTSLLLKNVPIRGHNYACVIVEESSLGTGVMNRETGVSGMPACAA